MYHILLVDDEAEERDGVNYLIQKYKFPLRVAMAPNGQKALEYIKNHPVDILFTDVKMPLKDGLALAAETCLYNPDIRIIIFSAYGEFEYAKKAMEAHAVDYLLKPVELDEFVKVMDKVISQLDEQRKQTDMAREVRLVDQKRLLYKVFTGGCLSEFENGQLDRYFEGLGHCRKVLISLETGGNLFEQQETVFLKLLDTYLPIGCEYVNLYPNASVLLHYAAVGLMDAEFKSSLDKLKRDVKMLLQDELSVVVSREFDTVQEMIHQTEELNTFRREYYGTGEGTVYLSKTLLNSEYYAAETEKIKALMLKAIEAKDTSLVVLYGDQLVDTMVHGHVVSRIYVHHIFYDVLAAFYAKYGIRDKARVFENVELLLSYKDSPGLLKKFRQVLNEGLAEQAEGMTDSSGIAERIKAIVEAEYGNDIGLYDIAGRVNLAPAYVSYLFKKETGANLVKYITDYRMEKARKFLEDKELKIIQVGKACGYENQPYFNRLFKNYFGMTPKQYRERG